MTAQTSASKRSGPLIIAILVLTLLVLHQDNWFWSDGTLILGFMPVGLLWHACISIAAASTWFLATKIAWPFDNIARVDAGLKADTETGEGQH
jgi:hypothetical protein